MDITRVLFSRGPSPAISPGGEDVEPTEEQGSIEEAGKASFGRQLQSQSYDLQA